MKYTININQKAIVDLGLQGKVDFIDLAIYDFITEFMMCDDCVNIQIANTKYFWIKAELIIENLPLLGITTPRGINKRIDNLVECRLLERCDDNQSLHQSFYKVGANYKAYKFFTWNKNSKLAWNENSNNNNIDNNNITNNKRNKEEEKEYKEKSDALFEECWLAYRRKGKKGKSLPYWEKLTENEKQMVLPHIKAYVSSRELQFQQDFERYLRDKTFTTIVFQKNMVVYDPTKGTKSDIYTPELSPLLMWNDYYTCYMYLGYWDGHISDGYNDDNRPNGAQITLNNGRGIIKWDANNKKWVLE